MDSSLDSIFSALSDPTFTSIRPRGPGRHLFGCSMRTRSGVAVKITILCPEPRPSANVGFPTKTMMFMTKSSDGAICTRSIH